MSKNLFDRLSPLAAFATQLFSNAGLDLPAMLAAGDADALKSHLATLSAGEGAAAAIEQATKTLQADLTAAQTSSATAAASLTLYVNALEQSGITPQAADEKAGLQASDIAAAINARISLKAAEEMAKLGTPPVDNKPKTEAPGQKKTIDPKLTGLARAIAANQLSQPAK